MILKINLFVTRKARAPANVLLLDINQSQITVGMCPQRLPLTLPLPYAVDSKPEGHELHLSHYPELRRMAQIGE